MSLQEDSENFLCNNDFLLVGVDVGNYDEDLDLDIFFQIVVLLSYKFYYYWLYYFIFYYSYYLQVVVIVYIVDVEC